MRAHSRLKYAPSADWLVRNDLADDHQRRGHVDTVYAREVHADLQPEHYRRVAAGTPFMMSRLDRARPSRNLINDGSLPIKISAHAN